MHSGPLQAGDLILLLRSSKLHPSQVYPVRGRGPPAIGAWAPPGGAALKLASYDGSDHSGMNNWQELSSAALDEEHDRRSASVGAPRHQNT